ncbi:MAG: hypothetical protein HY713_09315 [candidate division NC10 bacterium]|nr:hypothetical protein [candidate division NC10 bacterium]
MLSAGQPKDPLIEALDHSKGCKVKRFGFEKRYLSTSLSGLPVIADEALAGVVLFPREGPVADAVSNTAEKIMIERIPGLSQGRVCFMVTPEQQIQRGVSGAQKSADWPINN